MKHFSIQIFRLIFKIFSVLKTGFLFVASEFGNHYLYQIAHLGDDDDEPEFSSAMPLEEGDTFFFAPRPLRNLLLVDELDSLSPILSSHIADLGQYHTHKNVKKLEFYHKVEFFVKSVCTENFSFLYELNQFHGNFSKTIRTSITSVLNLTIAFSFLQQTKIRLRFTLLVAEVPDPLLEF